MPERPPEAAYVEATDEQLGQAVLATEQYMRIGNVYTPIAVSNDTVNSTRAVVLELLAVGFMGGGTSSMRVDGMVQKKG